MDDDYTRYVYFADKPAIDDLEQKGIRLLRERRLPCMPLKFDAPAVVEPDAWRGVCKRQGSWYWQSPYAGQYLIVSPHPLQDLPGGWRVAASTFQPDTLPDKRQARLLAKNDIYLSHKPPEFDHPSPTEKKWYTLGGQDFDTVFLWHNANHANFLTPAYFVREGGRRAPYSITDTDLTCSSCLEFFNILGDDYPKKYVVPCVGCHRFTGLPKDRYFLVERLS